MKKSMIGLVLGLSLASFSAMAQDNLTVTAAVIISPTITTVRLLASTVATTATGSLAKLESAQKTFQATIYSVEAKGANAKAELREEATMAIDVLVNGEELVMRDYKTLSSMIDDLKNNEVTSLEISEAARKNEVSFEVMAINAIMLASDI